MGSSRKCGEGDKAFMINRSLRLRKPSQSFQVPQKPAQPQPEPQAEQPPEPEQPPQPPQPPQSEASQPPQTDESASATSASTSEAEADPHLSEASPTTKEAKMQSEGTPTPTPAPMSSSVVAASAAAAAAAAAASATGTSTATKPEPALGPLRASSIKIEEKKEEKKEPTKEEREALGKVETLEANRVKMALEHRKLVYKELHSFDQVLMYHRQWLEQPPLVRSNQVAPDAATLDPRGDDLPLDKLHALATQSQVKSVAVKAAAAMDGDRNLLHVDRYVYWYDTKAPPSDWKDVMPHLLALHDVTAGFLVADMGLPPAKGAGTGFTWITGFVDEKWSHYVKYALDTTMACSTYILPARPWLKNEIGTSEQSDGADRLTHVSNGIRYFRKFPTEEPIVFFRKFMQPINPKLVDHFADRCVLMTVIDHIPGRRDWLLKLVAKVLRNRHKVNNPSSRSRGLNYYIPAIQGLRKERDESQRLHFVRGIQNVVPNMNIKELLETPLNELRVKYWTYFPHETAL